MVYTSKYCLDKIYVYTHTPLPPKHFSLIFIMKTQVKQHSRKYINKKQSLIIKKNHVYIGLT